MLAAVIVVSVLIGFVVGAGVIGTAAQRMGRQRSQPVWRQEVAATYLESHLPYEVAAELQPGDLRDLLRRHINQLQYEGRPEADAVAAAEVDDSPVSDSNTTAADADADLATLTTHNDAVANLYAQARADGLEITKPIVEEIIRVHLEYLHVIGALVQSADQQSADQQSADQQ